MCVCVCVRERENREIKCKCKRQSVCEGESDKQRKRHIYAHTDSSADKDTHTDIEGESDKQRKRHTQSYLFFCLLHFLSLEGANTIIEGVFFASNPCCISNSLFHIFFHSFPTMIYRVHFSLKYDLTLQIHHLQTLLI